MNKRIKNKINKGIFWHFNGRMAWKYHAYQANRNSKEIMVSYDNEGNEFYCLSWKEAKQAIRTMGKRPELSWPEDNTNLNEAF